MNFGGESDDVKNPRSRRLPVEAWWNLEKYHIDAKWCFHHRTPLIASWDVEKKNTAIDSEKKKTRREELWKQGKCQSLMDWWTSNLPLVDAGAFQIWRFFFGGFRTILWSFSCWFRAALQSYANWGSDARGGVSARRQGNHFGFSTANGAGRYLSLLLRLLSNVLGPGCWWYALESCWIFVSGESI